MNGGGNPAKQYVPIECSDLPAGCGDGERRLAKDLKRCVMLRRHHAALYRSFLENHPAHGLLRAGFLYLHHDRDLGKSPKHVRESRHSSDLTAKRKGAPAVHAEAGAGIHLTELRQRQRAHRTSKIGGTIQGGVVQHHGHTVPGEPHVQFERVGTLAYRQLESRQRILRGRAGRAAMRYHRSGGQIEQRIHLMSIASLRREYARARLDEASVNPDPLVEFARWFDEALRAQVLEPNAMTLATATSDGAPSARTVLLKGFDQRGFVFFTDYRSRKGGELDHNPRAALVFYWGELERQVRITGTVERTSVQESEAYFQTRPLGSRLGAWVSHQSSVIPSREPLESGLRAIKERFSRDEVPLPPHWGGYRVRPQEIEFWQGRENRLHDRIRYVRDGERWRVERLSP